MTFNKAFVTGKLTEIKKYQNELRELLNFNDKDILNDSGKMHIAERLLQLIVDTILDINQHFIKELELEVAEDFQSTFYILGKHKVIPEDFANKIAPVVGLRNRVVHRYDTLNENLFIKSLRENYRDFDLYIQIIQKRLEEN